MANDWKDLTDLTQGKAMRVERVRLVDSGVAVEGSFELPPLARLVMDDQVFVMAFIRSHGSIKQMEKLFGVSYPTIKNRLNRIGEQFEFIEVAPPASPAGEVLDQLERGEITVKEALERLKEQ